MTKNELHYQILKLKHEHKKPAGLALNFADWKSLILELHETQRIEDYSSEILNACKFMGVQLFLKVNGEPEFLFVDPNDVLRPAEA